MDQVPGFVFLIYVHYDLPKNCCSGDRTNKGQMIAFLIGTGVYLCSANGKTLIATKIIIFSQWKPRERVRSVKLQKWQETNLSLDKSTLQCWCWGFYHTQMGLGLPKVLKPFPYSQHVKHQINIKVTFLSTYKIVSIKVNLWCIFSTSSQIYLSRLISLYWHSQLDML